MALPQVETGVMEMIAEEEANAQREAALEAVSAPAASAKETALATASQTGLSNPSEFLHEQGIDNLKIDFTSFPTITLNKAVFSSPEHASFGTEFEFVYMDKRDLYIFRGDLGRDKDPELVYSDDGVTDNKEGRPIAEYIADWEKRAEVIGWDKKAYTMVIGTMVNSVHAGDIVQLQIPPTSQGKLSGYLYGLGFKKISPRDVVTKVSVGAEIGSGTRAFNPWVFKKV